MKLDDFCRAVAHGAVAELLRLGLSVPVAEACGIAAVDGVFRVTVLVSRDYAAVVAKMNVSEIQWQALSVMSKDRTTKAEVIAMRCGRKCGGSYRGMLSQLVRMNLIRHVKRQGYVLTDAGEQAVRDAPFARKSAPET